MTEERQMAPEVSAGGVVVDGGQVLVIRHARGEWIMPKGHVEPGEEPEQAALREVREETGLEARIIAPLGETSYAYRRKGEAILRPKRVIWYLMRPVTPRDRLRLLTAEGLLEAAWLGWEEARQRLTWAGDRRILQRAAALPAAQRGYRR
ncbi:MAG: NUDIX domain-containing protein [Bacillota bacterium]|nr:NUDIX domain-containing protein [Bacillota bacterium]